MKMGEAPHTLFELDYLLRVDDEARQGALRFALKKGGPFLADSRGGRIPPLLELPKLLTASEHVIDDTDDEEDLRLLLAPGSSLGGARPKASIRNRKGDLALAKFPSKSDEWDINRWEAVAFSLAEKSGIVVPSWSLETIGGRTVLISRRFDRVGTERVPFLSGMSLLGARDHETRNYLEILDTLRRYGARFKKDARELWRRLIFTILISNVDNHLRNHGFLHTAEGGWTLSPAYDLNPVPVDVRPRFLSTAIDEQDQKASIESALAVSDYFELSREESLRIAKGIALVVSKWRTIASSLGCSKSECDRMSSAFEHQDLETAITL